MLIVGLLYILSDVNPLDHVRMTILTDCVYMLILICELGTVFVMYLYAPVSPLLFVHFCASVCLDHVSSSVEIHRNIATMLYNR